MSTDIIARGMAAAQARSSGSAALVSALRNNAFVPQPAYRNVSADVATITVGAANIASTINAAPYGSANVSLTNTAKLTWLAGTSDTDANLTYFARGAWYGTGRTFAYNAFEFTHTGTQFELTLLASTLVAGVNCRVLVGGKIAGTAAVTPDGNWHYVKIAFPTSATRRIRIELCGGRPKGLNVAAIAEVVSSGRNYPLVTLIGDSFPEGTGANQHYDAEGIATLRALGFNPANASVGGTGLLNPGSGGRVNWQDSNRLADLALNGWTDAITGTAPVPAMGVVMMSINDSVASSLWGGAASLQEAVNKALWTLIDHWNTQRPGKPLVVFGPTWPGGDPVLDIYRLRDAGQEACFGASGSNVWFLDRLGPGTLSRTGANTFISSTGTTTNASASITAIASTAGWSVGAGIEGVGIPAGARIVTIASSTAITIDSPATATGTAVALLIRNTQASLYGLNAADPTHPGPAGHNLDTLLMARDLRRLILTEFA